MKKYFSIMTIFSLILLISCGKEAKEAQQAMEMMKDLPQKAEQMQQDMNNAEKRQQERRQRGDTLSLNYKKLQEYLPKSVDGYGDAKLSGESVNMGGFSMSQAEAEYQNAQSGNSVNIQFIDYNENYGMYAGLAFWLKGYSMENDQRMEKTFDTGLADVWALEKFEKSNGEVELIYAIGWRFMLTIKAPGQKDTEFLKSVAKKMDLNALSKM
jgi:hypothetical protein